MAKILNRDEFIREIYEPMMEQKKYDEIHAINEGLLKNLFCKVKNLFVDDWKKISGDETIKNAYKEMDDKLTGYVTMKMSNRDSCNEIRQELVDFACMWYDKKKNSLKDGKTPKVAANMKFKDEALQEGMEKCEKRIKDIAGENAEMAKWAEILLDNMKTIINQSIVAELDDEEAKKEYEEQIKKDLQDSEKRNQMMEEISNKWLEEIQKERESFISDAGGSPMAADLLGDKACQNIYGDFGKIGKIFAEVIKDGASDEQKKDAANNLKKAMSDDTMLAFKTLFSEDDMKKADEFKVSLMLMNSFYEELNKNAKNFKDTPGQSVQAMCISINSFVKNSVYGGEDYGNCLPLMAKCAINSDATVGYALPLANPKETNVEKQKNWFVYSVGKFIDQKFKISVDYPDEFKRNAETLSNKIISEAKKLKEEADKKHSSETQQIKDAEKSE